MEKQLLVIPIKRDVLKSLTKFTAKQLSGDNIGINLGVGSHMSITL